MFKLESSNFKAWVHEISKYDAIRPSPEQEGLFEPCYTMRRMQETDSFENAFAFFTFAAQNVEDPDFKLKWDVISFTKRIRLLSHYTSDLKQTALWVDKIRALAQSMFIQNSFYNQMSSKVARTLHDSIPYAAQPEWVFNAELNQIECDVLSELSGPLEFKMISPFTAVRALNTLTKMAPYLTQTTLKRALTFLYTLRKNVDLEDSNTRLALRWVSKVLLETDLQIWVKNEPHGNVHQVKKRIEESFHEEKEVLDLSFLLIGKLPFSIGLCSSVKKLDLKYMHLQHLSEAIFEIEELEALDLTGNDFYEISYLIGDCKNLQSLALQNLRYLRSLPETFFQLSKLKYLSLEYTPINQEQKTKIEEMHIKNLLDK